ncbi:hypothetical protein U8P80_26235 (plasmid) [Rhizobium beringeri]|nr:hypothetical protein U8P80_26235 [Rhizobium beringeri]WSH17392.1 hypothetical protein U8P74_26235 [Rhizobium beringeri]
MDKPVTEGKSSTPNVVLAAVVAALFGSHAMDLGALITFAGDKLCGGATQTEFRVEAGLLVLGIGYIVLLAAASTKALGSRDKDDVKAVAVTAAVGLLGGFFSILDKTANQNTGAPTEATAQGLFQLALVALVFAAPIAFLSRRSRISQRVVALVYQLAVAALIAGGAGIVIQLAMRILSWSYGTQGCTESNLAGIFRLGTTAFFISAPMTAFILAPWALLAIDPLVRRERWPRIRGAGIAWLSLMIIAAIALSTFYAYAFYRPSHFHPGIGDGGWVVRAGLSWPSTVWFLLLLQIPAIIGTIVLIWFRQPKNRDTKVLFGDMPGLLIVGLITAGAAAIVAVPLIGQEDMTPQKAWLFVITHALTGLATAVGVMVTYRNQDKSKAIGS